MATFSAEAAISAASSVSADPEHEYTAVAAIAAASAVAASAFVPEQGAADIAAASSVSASFEIVHNGTAAITAASSVSASVADLSFQDAEESDAAQPIELYTFTAGGTTYRLTSYSSSYEFSGDTYTRAAIERTSLKLENRRPGNLEITLPRSEALVSDAVFATSLGEMSVTVRRVYDSDTSAIIWRGAVRSVQFRGDAVTLSVPSRWEEALRAEVSRVLHQKTCNHRLYDRLCGLDADDFTESTTVSSIDSDEVTIEVASVGGESDQHFKRGRLVHTESGEERLITDQTGTTVTIAWPVDGMEASDSIDLIAGCDLTIEECRDKFDNVDRFGGMPFIPARSLLRTRTAI